MRRGSLAGWIGLGVLVVAGCAGRGPVNDRELEGPAAGDATLLANVRVFDPVGGVMSEPQDVLIENGVVKRVGPGLPRPKGGRVIDGTGKFAVPGLFDCHTHLAHLTTGDQAEMKARLAEFARRGVMQVRDVGGPIEVLKTMHDRIAAGELAGPEIFYCGPMLESSPLTYANMNETLPGFTVAIDTPEDVDRVLPELAGQGARMIKVFSKVGPDLFRYLAAAAERNALRIVYDPGMPLFHRVAVDAALEMGVTSFEHAKAPWPAVLTDELRAEHDRLVGPEANDMARMMFMMRVAKLGTESVSIERVRQLADRMVEKNAYLCPTLNVLSSLETAAIAQIKEQQHVDEIPEMMMNAIRTSIAALDAVSRLLARELAGRGVKMLVGQDGIEPTGVATEMRWMRDCGVANVEILRGATIYPARWLGVDERLGSIAPGRQARILIVNGDPLEDVANIENVFMVWPEVPGE